MQFNTLHDEALGDLYRSPRIVRVLKSRKLRYARHVAIIGNKINAYRILVGKRIEKRSLGRSEYKIEIDFTGVGRVGERWLELAPGWLVVLLPQS
jgi:uncharacterized C2H2 Zn-finger protein